MNQLPDQAVPEGPRRKQTPRVPANFLYSKLVPISIAVLVVVLVVVMVAVIASLFIPPVAY